MYVCLQACITGGVLPDALTYIHTSLAYIHTCIRMFETVNHHPKAGSDSSRKAFSIERLIQFFEICEGGYFQMP